MQSNVYFIPINSRLLALTDIAFLMSNHFKKERKSGLADVAQASGDVLYEEFTKGLLISSAGGVV
jgi:hypothetical protein